MRFRELILGKYATMSQEELLKLEKDAMERCSKADVELMSEEEFNKFVEILRRINDELD